MYALSKLHDGRITSDGRQAAARCCATCCWFVSVASSTNVVDVIVVSFRRQSVMLQPRSPSTGRGRELVK